MADEKLHPKAYDSLHKIWDIAHENGSPTYFVRKRVIIRSIKKLVRNKVVLDFGCGTGDFSLLLADLGASLVYSYDISAYALSVLKEKISRSGAKRISIVRDIDNLPPESIDISISIEVFEHLESPVLAMKELNRVTRPGGYLFFTVPAHRYLWSKFDEISLHIKRYSKKQIKRELLKAGWKDLYIKSYGFPLLFIYTLLRNNLLSETTLNISTNKSASRVTKLYPFAFFFDSVNMFYPMSVGIYGLAVKEKEHS